MRKHHLKNRERNLKLFKEYRDKNRADILLKQRKSYQKRMFENDLRLAELREGDPERIMELFEKIKT